MQQQQLDEQQLLVVSAGPVALWVVEEEE